MKKTGEQSKQRWMNTTRSLAYASGRINAATKTLSRSEEMLRDAGHMSEGETEVKWWTFRDAACSTVLWYMNYYTHSASITSRAPVTETSSSRSTGKTSGQVRSQVALGNTEHKNESLLTHHLLFATRRSTQELSNQQTWILHTNGSKRKLGCQ